MGVEDFKQRERGGETQETEEEKQMLARQRNCNNAAIADFQA